VGQAEGPGRVAAGDSALRGGGTEVRWQEEVRSAAGIVIAVSVGVGGGGRIMGVGGVEEVGGAAGVADLEEVSVSGASAAGLDSDLVADSSDSVVSVSAFHSSAMALVTYLVMAC